MRSDPSWNPGSARPQLDAQGVDVWRVDLEVTDERLDRLRRHLCEEERARAGRFHFDRDRRAFTAARGSLREILARYLEFEPGAVAFSYGPRGKPELAGDHRSAPVHFNLSHAAGLALVAVGREGGIGVDIERVDRSVDHRSIAERFFSPTEIEALPTAEPELARAFFTCWTRKEAFIKALGEGLAVPLDSFDVMRPGDLSPLLETRLHAEVAAGWSLRDLDPDPAYAAALVAPKRMQWLRCWQFG